jgi:nicotinate-nucleotide adenylyltransferase
MQIHSKAILFGGSFDPIHSGHLCVARHAMQELDARDLIFIPARRSPHKMEAPTPGKHRYAMIEEAIKGIDGFSVNDCELLRPEPSYTIDTVRFFRDQFGPDTLLYWLIGADQLTDLGKWYHIDELMDECRVSVMIRAGYPLPDIRCCESDFSSKHLEQLKEDVVPTPLIDLASTDIRSQLASGQVPPDALPSGVLNYIKQHRLYGYV